VLGYNCVDVAATYLNMVNIFKKTGEYERVIEYNHKSLEIKVSMVGHDHLLVGKSYYNMDCLYATRDHDLCCNMLLRTEETGWLGTPSGTSLEHMKTDTDLDPVRELEWYKQLILCLGKVEGEEDEE
jgi:hypothetical protein